MKPIHIILFIFLTMSVAAQTASSTQSQLATQFTSMIEERTDSLRKMKNLEFIPSFVNLLKEKNSFHNKYEDLRAISVLYPADSTFRIITWAVPEGDYEMDDSGNAVATVTDKRTFKYHGAIQMNTPDLEIYPLIDRSNDKMWIPDYEIQSNEFWYGCIYYDVVQKEYNDTMYYTLIGWDGYDEHSNKKIADVLTISDDERYEKTEEGLVKEQYKKFTFGAPIFEVRRDSFIEVTNRFIYGYKEDAAVTLKYVDEYDAIIFDFVAPPSPESRGAYGTYIPDGTYDGLIFENGAWRYKQEIYKYLGVAVDAQETNPVFGGGGQSNGTHGKKKRKRRK